MYMTIAAMETNKVLFAILVLIDILFLGLVMDSFSMGHGWHTIAAWSELIISLLGFYGAAAITLNIHFGKQFLPTGKPFGIFK
ncbi:hypothetical protein SCACP_19690 [Sporomusa carbonis]|uniref:hypothetical protein n=1 Tax=Sporomusa carbonis TaxID=3076075 RepID=UPI003A5DC391